MTPRAGVRLDGRYELSQQIAVGGMGQVWAAVELSTREQVAVKVLRPEFAGEQLFLDRIAAEARNAQVLHHPGIARTYDHGVVDGLGYLVMQFVYGEPLSEVLAREGTLSPARVLDIMAQTADALTVAHAAGVVHRDIKPANLLVSADGHVTITDFGISIAANQAPMTAAGMVMGTAQYLPPEQAMGRPATGAGDVYALGIIAYESLVGRRPFTGATQVDIAFAHVTEPLPPLPGTIDLPLRVLVEQMLAKDPADRPRSAQRVSQRARDLLAQIDAWDPSAVVGAWPTTGQFSSPHTPALPVTPHKFGSQVPTTSGPIPAVSSPVALPASRPIVLPGPPPSAPPPSAPPDQPPPRRRGAHAAPEPVAPSPEQPVPHPPPRARRGAHAAPEQDHEDAGSAASSPLPQPPPDDVTPQGQPPPRRRRDRAGLRAARPPRDEPPTGSADAGRGRDEAPSAPSRRTLRRNTTGVIPRQAIAGFTLVVAAAVTTVAVGTSSYLGESAAVAGADVVIGTTMDGDR